MFRAMDLLMGLSPEHLIQLRQQCETELSKRHQQIERILSLKFSSLDKAFVCVNIGPFHGIREGTQFTYGIKAPSGEIGGYPGDYSATLVSGFNGVNDGHRFWIGRFSSGAPTKEQIEKIKKVDSEFRDIYMCFMRRQPRLAPVAEEEPAK